MFDQLTERFCILDDFCKEIFLTYDYRTLEEGWPIGRRGPKGQLAASEIMMLMILYQESRFQNLKAFYAYAVQSELQGAFPGLVSYERFVYLQSRLVGFLTVFFTRTFKEKTGRYTIDSTALPVCHNRRIERHKVFQSIARRGKTSVDWFFGLKAHFIINHRNKIVSACISAGNIPDTAPVAGLMKGLTGKIFGDRGYISKELTENLKKEGLELVVNVRKNMKPISFSAENKEGLKKRRMVETVIGRIKEGSSLNFSRSRNWVNAIAQLMAALIAYQFKPIQPKTL